MISGFNPAAAKARCSGAIKERRTAFPLRTHHHALLCPRPHESSALQPFGVQAQPVAITPQQLDQIAAATAKAEYVPGERVLPEHRLCLCRQAVEPLAHVSGTGRQPYPGARRKRVRRSVIIEAKLAATTEACRCAGSEGRGPSGGRSSLRASGAHQATRARARVFAILKDRRAGDESSAITVNPLHQPSTAGGQIVNHLRLMQPQPIEVDQIDVRSETRCEAAAIGKAEEIGGLDGRDSSRLVLRSKWSMAPVAIRQIDDAIFDNGRAHKREQQPFRASTRG